MIFKVHRHRFVAGLSSVKRHLRDIQDQTLTVQDKVGQLKLGLGESKNRLIGSFFYLHTYLHKNSGGVSTGWMGSA